MKRRDLKCVKLFISDKHKGIVESVTRSFIDASWKY
ncbi:transposase [Oxyplasma meridianum]|uniref:Transposase n=1 Tax=Oxyplasma meridianum TaxID=3073602 RepID=A0AAX4NEL5_9ARCH